MGDWDGYVHVFSDDGLFVKRLFRGTRKGVDQNVDRDCITSYELGHIRAFAHPTTGRTYVMGQSLEGGEHIRVFEIHGLDDVGRTTDSFAVTAADLQGVMPKPRTRSALRAPVTKRQVAITSVLEPPVVNGRLDAWRRLVAPEMVGDADDPAQVRVVLRYDEKYLYLGAQCDNDDSPAVNAYYPSDPENVWRGDCVNLFINTRPDVHRDRQKYEAGDLHLMFPLDARYADRDLDPHCRTRAVALAGATYRLHVLGPTSWTMTARIPWNAIGAYVPKPGDKLHMNVQVDFADPTGKSHLFSLNLGGMDRGYAVPALWNVEGVVMYAR